MYVLHHIFLSNKGTKEAYNLNIACINYHGKDEFTAEETKGVT